MSRIQNDMPTAHDPHWWGAPVVVTLLGLPLLGLEYAMWGVNAFGFFGGMVGWALGFLVLAWVLPRRRSVRMLRVTSAVAGLVFAVLPVVFVVMIGMAMASG
jgi:uncharacterized protein (TIGR03382 family)